MTRIETPLLLFQFVDRGQNLMHYRTVRDDRRICPLFEYGGAPHFQCTGFLIVA